jgi:CheY-like chemotaxis protein
VLADPGQLEQAVMDLAVNGREAMPAGGRLTVVVDELELGGVVAGCREPVRPGRYVRISVADTGSGMTEEAAAHAFEPFFSTKEFGSGLGLASVHGIVHQSNGYVALDSSGAGTTVTLYLPRVDAPERSAPPPVPSPVAGSTVLLVEDEAAVRDLTTRLLRRLGYRVLVACDGAEALEVAAAEPGPIAALVTDVVMPGRSGPELARELERHRPGLPTLFVSGYAHDAAALEEVLASGGRLLSKPFGQAQLGRALAEVLASNGA